MAARAFRIGWTVLTWIVVEVIVAALAAFPVVVVWMWGLDWTAERAGLRLTILSLALLPSYAIFALGFMLWSALAVRSLGWRSPPEAAMRIHDVEWNLLHWVRYVAASHLVRVVAGTLFRATPVWTLFLRWNGAKIGRRVYVNSMSIMDHNLLELGEGTVIGADVHLSGHTVEGGIVYTGRVRLGRNVTLGAGSVIGIAVDVGDNAQVGALSLVPKHSTLPGGAVYFGIPVQQVQTNVRAAHARNEIGHL